MKNILVSLTDDMVDLLDAACETYEVGRAEYIESMLWRVNELKDLARRCRIKRQPRSVRGRPPIVEHTNGTQTIARKKQRATAKTKSKRRAATKSKRKR